MKILFSGFTSGGTIEKIIKAERFNRVIIFTSEKFVSKAKDFLKSIKLRGQITKLNPFELNSLMQVVGNEIKKNSMHQLIINITEGTNLMAAAFLCSSYYYGIRTVSVNDDCVIELPIPSLKEMRILPESSKRWLINISKESYDGSIPLMHLSKGISPQRLAVPLRILKKAGFIEIEHAKIKKVASENDELGISEEIEVNKRSKIVKLTPLGRLYSSFIKN